MGSAVFSCFFSAIPSLPMLSLYIVSSLSAAVISTLSAEVFAFVFSIDGTALPDGAFLLWSVILLSHIKSAVKSRLFFTPQCS